MTNCTTTPPITRFRGAYAFLSSFHPCVVGYNGIVYPSVEHAYQAAKALSWEDAIRLRDCRNAAEAKSLGRRIQCRPDFDAVKLDVMRGLVEVKFRNHYLRSRLHATHDAELIEGNDWGDVFWGVSRGIGENHLGRILMAERARIATETSPYTAQYACHPIPTTTR